MNETVINDLGVCPTNEHSLSFPQCGFVGCVDLRPWAKADGYRYRLDWPALRIGKMVRFDHRLFMTTDPKLQELIETRPYFGVQVREIREEGGEMSRTNHGKPP